MKKTVLLALMLVLVVSAMPAQEKITDRLQRDIWGQGKVSIHQDDALYTLLGSYYDSSQKKQAKGYRIQIYAGGNTREARNAANSAAATARRTYPELSIYTEFISPRWVCRVGDYKTYEEADAQLRAFKQDGLFRDATILPNQIITINY